jgi:hypothetical protein
MELFAMVRPKINKIHVKHETKPRRSRFEDAFCYSCHTWQLDRKELVTQLRSFLFEILDLLFFVLLLVLVHADCFIFHFVLVHPMDHPRDRMRG